MAESIPAKSELHRVAQFGAVGIINTVIDIVVFNLLNALGVPPTLGSGISFLAANINGYIMNRQWTFGDKKSDKVAAQYSQYLLAGVVGFIINVLVVKYSVALLSGQPQWLVLNGAKLVAIVLTVAWNYATSRFFIFDRIKK